MIDARCEPLAVGNTTLCVRPIDADDVDRLSRMFDRLSPMTVYRRFFSPFSCWCTAYQYIRISL